MASLDQLGKLLQETPAAYPHAAGAAAAAAAIVLVVGRLACWKRPGGAGGPVAIGLALAAAYVAAQLDLVKWHGWLPSDGYLRLPLVLLPVAALGAVLSARRPPTWLAWALRLAAGVALAGVLLIPLHATDWRSRAVLADAAGVALATALVWGAFEGASARLHPRWWLVAAGLAAGVGTPVVLGLGAMGNASVFAGGVGVAIAAAFGVSLVWRDLRMDGAPSAVLAVTLVGLWTVGVHYGYVPRAAAVALVVATVAAPWSLVDSPAWARRAAALVLLLATLGAAAYVTSSPPGAGTTSTTTAEPDDYGYGDDDTDDDYEY